MIWIKLEDSIPEVTQNYLEIIGEAMKCLDKEVKYVNNISGINYCNGDYVVVSNAVEALKVLLRGYRIIYWAQGIWPEESFMKHKSKLRYAAACFLEKKALKKSSFTFFVSKQMKVHYEKKYNIDFKKQYYIMPCVNDELHREAFETKGKYDNNVFCYVGSTAVWQCFEETIKLYKAIESNSTDTKLLLLVKDSEYAKKLLEKYNVINYEIDYVPISKLGEYLKNVKFGFVLRKPDEVNKVATPTKIATYLSYGIIPVYSDCLYGIDEMLCEEKYRVCYTGNIDRIRDMMNCHIDFQEVLKDFEGIYKKYYTRQIHIERLSECIKDRLY